MSISYHRTACFISLLGLWACSGATEPSPSTQFNGNWNAVSLNGSPLPVNYTFGVLQIRAVYRTLTIIGDTGSWNDSTETTANGTTFYSGHHSSIQWSTTGSQLTVIVSNLPSTPFVLDFTVQGDGSLLETKQDGANVVYRRAP